jgi:hypothetical protein
MAEIRKGEEFLSGFLGALNDRVFDRDKQLERQSKLAAMEKNNADMAVLQSEHGLQRINPQADNSTVIGLIANMVRGQQPAQFAPSNAAPDQTLSQLFLQKAKNQGVTDEMQQALQTRFNKKPLQEKHLAAYNQMLLETKDEDYVTDPVTGRSGMRNRRTGEIKPIEIGDAGGAMNKYPPKALNYISQAQKSYQSDPLVKSLKNQQASFSNMQQLLESGNAAAIGPLLSQMARGVAGEAGVLTEQDIQRNTGSQFLADRFGRWLKRNFTREPLTQNDLADFRDLMNKINVASQKRLASVTQGHVGRAHKLVGGDVNSLRQLIETPIGFDDSPMAPPVQSTQQATTTPKSDPLGLF